MKIYYINLDEDNKKNNYFLTQINQTSLKDKCEKFNAINGKIIDINNIDDTIITSNARNSITSQKQKIYGVSLTYGSLGCALSHKKLWEECVENNISYLIFEDDIIPHKNFNNIFNQILSSLNNIKYDIFYLGYNEIPGFRKIKINDVISKPGGLITGMYAYMVSPQGAKQLLSIFPLNKQIDSSISDNIHNFKAYCSTIKLVSVNTSFGSKTQRAASCKNNIQIINNNWCKLFQ
jgi:glycosyl transferase family 25